MSWRPAVIFLALATALPDEVTPIRLGRDGDREPLTRNGEMGALFADCGIDNHSRWF